MLVYLSRSASKVYLQIIPAPSMQGSGVVVGSMVVVGSIVVVGIPVVVVDVVVGQQ